MEKRWFIDNSVYDKLRQAIEQIAVGQGWEVFEGLDKGETTVKIIYEGENIRFEQVKQEPKPEEAVVFEEPEPTRFEPQPTSRVARRKKKET